MTNTEATTTNTEAGKTEAGKTETNRSRLSRAWSTEASLARYRVMAFVVGTGLALLCFVGVPLQLVHDRWPWTSVVQIVGPLHGFLYIVYLMACLDLAARARFRTVQLLGMVGSGLLPLLAFYMERKVNQRVSALLALGDQAPPGPAVAVWSSFFARTRPAPRSGAPLRPEGAEGNLPDGVHEAGPGQGPAVEAAPGPR